MLRLFASRSLHELYRNSQFVASCVTGRQQLLTCLPACQHRASVCARHLSTGGPVWKDALQPAGDKCEEKETIDLDKWKSVMRQAVSEREQQQQQQINEEDDGTEDESEGGPSSLETARALCTMWRHAGRQVPEEITEEQLEALSQLTTKSSRKKFLRFLTIKEDHKKKSKQKQEKKKAEKEAWLEERRAETGGETVEPRNTFLLQYWDRSLDKVLAWNSAQAMRFNQPLVFDLSYDSLMSRMEMVNTVSQLMEMEAWNRRAKEPFHLHFCNLQPGGAYEQMLRKRYGDKAWEQLLITSTEQRHVDFFPRESLVYLSPDSPNILRTFDHSKVYIIGAMVDRSMKPGASMANAKRLKLKTARLPLEDVLRWGSGAKNLTLDQMIRIMLTVRDTGNWEEALKFVPQRKHDGFHQVDMTDRRMTGQREDRQGQFRTFKNGDRPWRESMFASRERTSSKRENNAAFTEVRTSMKSNRKPRTINKGPHWWED